MITGNATMTLSANRNENATDDDPEGHASHCPYGHRHRRVPCHGPGKLAMSETQGLEQSQVPTPPHRGG